MLYEEPFKEYSSRKFGGLLLYESGLTVVCSNKYVEPYRGTRNEMINLGLSSPGSILFGAEKKRSCSVSVTSFKSIPLPSHCAFKSFKEENVVYRSLYKRILTTKYIYMYAVQRKLSAIFTDSWWTSILLNLVCMNKLQIMWSCVHGLGTSKRGFLVFIHLPVICSGLAGRNHPWLKPVWSILRKMLRWSLSILVNWKVNTPNLMLTLVKFITLYRHTLLLCYIHTCIPTYQVL